MAEYEPDGDLRALFDTPPAFADDALADDWAFAHGVDARIDRRLWIQNTAYRAAIAVAGVVTVMQLARVELWRGLIGDLNGLSEGLGGGLETNLAAIGQMDSQVWLWAALLTGLGAYIFNVLREEA